MSTHYDPNVRAAEGRLPINTSPCGVVAAGDTATRHTAWVTCAACSAGLEASS